MTNHPTRGRLALAAAAIAWIGAAAVRAQDPNLADVAEALLEARMPARDDADAVAERLLVVARANARSPTSALLVDSLGRVLDHGTAAPRRAVEGLRTLLSTDQLHGATRDAAASLLHRLSRIIDGDGADRATDPWADFASRWLAIGPFGDSGDFYGGVVFAPEAGFPPPGAVVRGRFGPVGPRVVEREPQRREVELGFGAVDPSGCEYGLHQVRAATATAGYAQVFARGSFELFVNDVQVRRLDRLQERTGPVVHVPVLLRAGVNHVVVKTTLADRSDVGLRYVDARGWPLAGLEELPPDRVHPRAAATAADGDAPPAPAPFVDPLDALLRAAHRAPPEADSLALAAALISFELGATDAGNELLFARAQQPPTAARAQLALAEVWRAATDVPQEIRDGEARRLLEAAADALQGHHFVTMRRADLLRGEDRIEDAIRLVRGAMADHGAGPETWDKLVDLYDALGARAEADVARHAWLAGHPLDARPRQALAHDRASAGDPSGALSMLDEGLAALPGHHGMLSQALSLAVDLGDRGRAQALIDLIHADAPTSRRALSDRARTLHELGDVDGAVALWNQRAAAADARADELREVGLSLWRAGARDDAQRALARSVAQRPSQHDLQRALERADAADGGRAPDFPRIARFRTSESEIDAIVRDFEPTGREAAAPSTLVLDSMVVEFLPDGGHIQEVHQLRRINDLSGVEAHEEATAAARADELVRLRTIGTDGRSYVPKRVGGTFAMPRLEPGAFVEELWRERFEAAGADPWRGPSFLFRGQDEAFLRSELVLVLPPGHPGSVRARGFGAGHERIPLDGGYEALRFVARDVPRLRPERMTPPLEELVPVVVYGDDRAPQAQARLARVGAAVRTRVTPWVSATAAAIVDGIEGDTPRARAIHAWVHDNIATERGSPDPTATLLRRQGPRFFLEVALMTAADIPLRPVSSTRGDERMSSDAPPLFVGDTEFSIPAARIEPRDGPALWLFADLPRHAPLGLVSGARAGAAALLADSGALTRVPDATEDAPGWIVDGRITLGEGGDAILEVALELRDEPGYALAQQVRDLDANRRTLVGRSIGAQLFEGWTVMDSALADPTPGARFGAQLKLRRRGALQQAGDVLQLALPMPPTDAVRLYGDPGPRELPLRLTGKTIEDWSLFIELGAALRPVGLPEGARVVGPMLDYQLSFQPEAGGVRVRRRFAIRPGTIDASRFGEWIHQLRRIDRAEDTRLEVRRG